MPTASRSLRRDLRRVGISNDAINAVWPEWWSEEAEASSSAVTELRYTVARRLGLSPRSLFDGPPRFVWHEEAKFKNLGSERDEDRAALTSFGLAIGRLILAGESRESWGHGPSEDPMALREAILRQAAFVELNEVLASCWSIGIPVVQLRVFPLDRKRMHAMTVRVDDRFAILLGRESSYPAQVAYTLAHELGHISLGHVTAMAGLVELGDPLQVQDRDEEETAADSFALRLLTGSPEPIVRSDRPEFNSRQVIHAVMERAPEVGIAPAMLALCLGHSTGRWRQVFGAMKRIPPGAVPVADAVNRLAVNQLTLDRLSDENRRYLLTVLGMPNDD